MFTVLWCHMEIRIGSDVSTSRWDDIRQLFSLAIRRPIYLSNKTAAVYVLLAVALLFAVALVEIPIRHYFPTSYTYLYMVAFLIASVIGIVYARDRFVISGANIPLVLAAIPISVTIFYVRVWLVGPAVVTVSGGWPSVSFLAGHFFLVCILIPASEEIMIRTLLFVGTARYIGYLPAAIITSTLFAVAHPQWVPAFIVSCILCYMAYRGVCRSPRHTNLVARILFHSIYNIVVIGLTFYNALGRL